VCSGSILQLGESGSSLIDLRGEQGIASAGALERRIGMLDPPRGLGWIASDGEDGEGCRGSGRDPIVTRSHGVEERGLVRRGGIGSEAEVALDVAAQRSRFGAQARLVGGGEVLEQRQRVLVLAHRVQGLRPVEPVAQSVVAGG
jgi:hypothetical protein